jgi:hypothetical protein
MVTPWGNHNMHFIPDCGSIFVIIEDEWDRWIEAKKKVAQALAYTCLRFDLEYWP